ncbi:MAG TPA: putative hydroxymethylpyrimidine transporter CytX, partial [Pseudomonas sp.]|nr:putative hydroxymethylpyrimidine transporter CytX [Pseudomonas sp.]
VRRRRLPGQIEALHWQALLAWAVGVAAYHLIAATAPQVGATLPALLLAGALHGLMSLSRGRETVRA